MIPKGLLPADLDDQAFIAGGWAACPALASDMDIWITADDLDYVATRTLNHLRKSSIFRVTPEAANAVSQNPGYTPNTECSTRRFAAVAHRVSGFKIHLMVTTGSVLDVLAGFDISAHQVAILPDGQVVKGPLFTAVNQPPVLLREHRDSAQRLVKVTKRYAPQTAFISSAAPRRRDMLVNAR